MRQEQADYWRRTLAGAPAVLELPADRARPPQQDYAGSAMPLSSTSGLTAGLKALSPRRGTTLFMTLLAGWAALLSRLSGQDDMVIGTPVANRGRVETEDLIGFFVNTLALRLDLSGDPTVGELLDRVKRGSWKRNSIRTCRSSRWWRSCGRREAWRMSRYSR